MVEAGIGQVQGEQILPVDPGSNRLGRLPIAQALAELQERDKRQPPGRVPGLTAPGIEISKTGVVEHRAEPVAQEKVGVATGKRGAGDAGGVVWYGWDGLAEARSDMDYCLEYAMPIVPDNRPGSAEARGAPAGTGSRAPAPTRWRRRAARQRRRRLQAEHSSSSSPAPRSTIKVPNSACTIGGSGPESALGRSTIVEIGSERPQTVTVGSG